MHWMKRPRPAIFRLSKYPLTVVQTSIETAGVAEKGARFGTATPTWRLFDTAVGTSAVRIWHVSCKKARIARQMRTNWMKSRPGAGLLLKIKAGD
jgi:hypothetical protein